MLLGRAAGVEPVNSRGLGKVSDAWGGATRSMLYASESKRFVRCSASPIRKGRTEGGKKGLAIGVLDVYWGASDDIRWESHELATGKKEKKKTISGRKTALSSGEALLATSELIQSGRED